MLIRPHVDKYYFEYILRGLYIYSINAISSLSHNFIFFPDSADGNISPLCDVPCAPLLPYAVNLQEHATSPATMSVPRFAVSPSAAPRMHKHSPILSRSPHRSITAN